MTESNMTRGLWDGIPFPLLYDGFSYTNPKLSPDGTKVAYLMGIEKGRYLYIYDIEIGLATQLDSTYPLSTGTEYGGETYCWSSDSKHIIFSNKGLIYRISAMGGIAEQLSNVKSSFSPYNVGSATIMVVEGKDRMELAIIDGNWPNRIPIDADFIYDPAIHPTTGDIAVHTWKFPNMSWNKSEIQLLVKSNKYEPVFISPSGDIATSQPRFSPDGRYIAFNCDATGWLNIWIAHADGSDAHVLVNEAAEHAYSTWVTGSRNYQWTSDSKFIIFTRNVEGFMVLCAVNISDGSIVVLEDKGGSYDSLSIEQNKLSLVYSDHQTREQVLIFDITSKNGISLENKRVIAQSGVAVPQKERAKFVKPRPIRCKNEDGEEVHALLYQRIEDSGPKPTIFAIHGGPTGMTLNKFHKGYQYFASRGWVVVAVNHRGSVGYGREYRESLNGNWGLHDVADTKTILDYLVKNGITNPRKTVIYGGSAGGYTVLMMLATHQGVMSAGVDLFGVTDLFLLSEETHFLESQYDTSLIGPLPEYAEVFKERSPVYLADQIEDPLLILQGEDDPVVPLNQSESIANSVTGRVVFKKYAGETHGFSKRDTLVDMHKQIDIFLRHNVLYK